MFAWLKRNWNELAGTRRYYGLRAAVRLFVHRALNLVARVRVTNVFILRIEDARMPPDYAPQFDFRFLTADEVRTFAEDPANDIGPGMAERIKSGRDLCFGALAGTHLASSCWFAPEWIEAEHTGGLAMSYPAHMAYAYKALTHPDFRGRRALGAVITLAFQDLARRGFRELVACVRWINDPSLRACARVGFKRLGRVVVIRVAGRQFVFVSRVLKAHGLHFSAEADADRQ